MAEPQVPAQRFAALRDFLNSRMEQSIGKTLGFTLVEIEDGRAVLEGVTGPHLHNPMGTIHGGFAATLLDSACGLAVHSKISEGQTFTTLELKIAYHKAMKADTGTVRAAGSLLAFGRRIAFAEAKLTDATGRLLASATSTLMITSP